MKPPFLAIALLPFLINPAHADNEAATAPASPPANVDAAAGNTQKFADRCTDFTTNGWAFKSPRNFLKWLDVFTDPAIYLEFAHRSLDPQAYVRSLSSLLEPGTPRNQLEWTNPDIYNQWAHSAVQPEFYNAVNAVLLDPARIMRWVMLPIDGRVWNVAGNAVDPNTWMKWLTAPADPKTQELLAKAANPETTQRWLEALTDPKNTPWFGNPSALFSLQPIASQPAAFNPTVEKIGL